MTTTTCWDLTGRVRAQGPVSTGLLRLDVTLPRAVDFQPGQFAMLNVTGPAELVFRRPFSILAADAGSLSFLYRVVGRGTRLLADLEPGDEVRCLAPLGRPFPAPAPDLPALILAGGVGLPPLHAWWARYRRPDDLAFFGGRDGGDVPWDLLDQGWQVSVDFLRDVPAGRDVFAGLVTALCERHLAACDPRQRFQVLACGPDPLLRAAARLAAARDWPCLVSVEEHMGCGYGICKGCVVPVRDPGPRGERNATACQEGPVFAGDAILWDRFGSASVGGQE